MEDEFPSKESSIFGSVNALCRHLSELPAEAFDEERKILYRRLRSIAYGYLLKKRTVKESVPDVEDVPLELFAAVVYEKSLRSEWTTLEFERASTLLARFEALSESGEYSWLADVGRFLIALNHLCPKEYDSPPVNDPRERVVTLRGIQDIPPTFRSPQSTFPHHWKLDTPTGPLVQSLVSQLERMRVPVAESVIEWGSRPDPSSTVSRSPLVSISTPHEDEGFSSPSVPAPKEKQPFDWSQFSIEHREMHRTWEAFNVFNKTLDTEYCPICCMRRVRKNIEFSPYELKKLQHTDLMTHVKALLVGVSSDVFTKVNGEFIMMPALYTEETPPGIMLAYFPLLKEAGTLFAQLQDLDGVFPCDTSASMQGVIKQFILDYHVVILSIPDSTGLLKVVLDVFPFIELLRYLVVLLKAVLEPDNSSALKGWMLLEKLYQDVCNSCHPKIFRLTSALFLSCCQAYYKFIDDWIFEGRWHQDLFFARNSPVEPIEDRITWKRMFSFSSKNAPTFLPSQCIFDCGMTVHLTRIRHHLENEGVDREVCPRVRLITDFEELDLAKINSKYYVQIGNALEFELLKVFNGDEDGALLQAAVDKAALDSLKYNKSLSEAYELKVAERIRKVQVMKQELAEYYAHKNLKSLKDNIMDLLEDDKIALAQLLQLISSTALRHELIAQFVQLQTKNIQRTKVNLWKGKRYALNTKRTRYWESLGLTKDGPGKFQTEVDASPLPSTLQIPAGSVGNNFGESVGKTLHHITLPSQSVLNPRTPQLMGTSQETSLAETVQRNEETNYITQRNTCQNSSTLKAPSSLVSQELHDSSEVTLFLAPSESRKCSQDSAVLMDDVEPPYCCQPAAYMLDSVLGPNADPFKFSMKTSENTCWNEQGKQKLSTLELRKSSLHYFTLKSLEYPLAAHNRLLNISVMHELFKENDLLGHLKRLKKVLLRDDGPSALAFTVEVSTKIGNETPANYLIYHKLNSSLAKAFSEDADYIAPRVNSTPPTFELGDPSVFSCVTLVYMTSWPVNLVLTEQAVSKYNDAFQLLFSLDRTLWYLHEASRTLVFYNVGLDNQTTEIQLQLHVMLVIVNGLKFYSGSVVKQSWDEFYTNLKSSKNHGELYLYHVKYLKKILRRFMLNKHASVLQEVLRRVLKQVHSYCQRLESIDWMKFATDKLYLQSRTRLLTGYYACFRKLVKTALRIIDRFVHERGYDHLIVLGHLLSLD